MALEFLKAYICCFCKDKEEDKQGYLDENTHLIPETSDPPVVYSNVLYVDHKKFQERLSHIVRAKEGKMVNIASNIPFNLHNQVVPPAGSRTASSRSTSTSIDPYRHSSQYDNYGWHTDQNQDDRSDYAYYHHGGHEPGPSAKRRSCSPTVEQPRPTPILNLRLVGYTETSKRGRTRQRSCETTSPASPGSRIGGPNITMSDQDRNENVDSKYEFKLHDPGSMTISWGD